MSLNHPSPLMQSNPAAQEATDPLSNNINRNIENVAAFHQREQGKMGDWQRRLETIRSFINRPIYLIALLAAILLWVTLNSLAPFFTLYPLDPPPFFWLQGILTLAALLTTTVVLITQNRQAALDDQRAHLDLQVNLLTEQKVTKLIHLIEELRRDLPMVENRHDPEAADLQQRTDTAQILSALQNDGRDGEA
jgi:uncharacterized membrane protein